MPLGRVDLNHILCVEYERVVGRDNVVAAERVALQVAKQPGRRTCAGLRVLVRRHLNGHHTVWHGPRCLGRYDERSLHGVKQLRSDHVSTTEKSGPPQ